MSILVFDSGVGGLSIAQAIRATCPQQNLVFASDNGGFPYGTRSESSLRERVICVLQTLLANTCPQLCVIACNSASTLVLEDLRTHFSLPFVGVVPAIKPAAAISKSRVIGLLATPATVQRRYTQALAQRFAADCQLVPVGSSELVHIAEQKLRGQAPDPNRLRTILEPLLAHSPQPDVLVLACTHFPLLYEDIRPLLPDTMQLVDSGDAVAKRVRDLLADPNTVTDPSPTHSAVFTRAAPDVESLLPTLARLGYSSHRIVPI